MTCDCGNSRFNDNSHEHVVTGNLEIIENVELRQLLSKGPNYRENEPPNKRKPIKAFSKGIDIYLENLSALLKEPLILQLGETPYSQELKIDFQKLKAIHLIKFYLNLMPKSIRRTSSKNMFLSLSIKQRTMWLLFARNSTYKCSKISQNFAPSSSSSDNLILERKQFLEKIGITLDSDNMKLPYLYWLPKFHKEIVGSRFVTSGSSCSTKQLST